jgi:hypothetical protein
MWAENQSWVRSHAPVHHWTSSNVQPLPIASVPDAVSRPPRRRQTSLLSSSVAPEDLLRPLDQCDMQSGAPQQRDSPLLTLSNRFQLLSDLPEDFIRPDPVMTSWRDDRRQRERVHRVCLEMAMYRHQTGRQPVTHGTTPADADSAEDVKGHLSLLQPLSALGYLHRGTAADPLWDRISLHRLRVRGRRHWFAVVHTLDGLHRLLVLKVPPEHFNSLQEQTQHARLQMTYRDTDDGLFGPGIRVKYAALLQLVKQPEDRAFIEQMQKGGIPLNFTTPPSPFHQRNYKSYTDQSARGRADLVRQVDSGFVEGPLHYIPRCVNPQGGIYQPAKDKWRTVHDLTASGVNACIAPHECSYDQIDHVVARMTPSGWQVGWDMSDAFFNCPRLQEHCDYLGLECAVTGEFYRHRWSVFGGTDCPWIQQRFATILKEVLNEQGQLRGLEQGWPSLSLLGIFLDDAHGVLDSSLSLPEASRQFQNQLDFMHTELNVVESVKKRVWPTKEKSYIGNLIQSEPQRVVPEPAKIDSCAAAGKMCREQWEAQQGWVSRRDWASYIGKLQNLAPRVIGGQGMLMWAYQDRDSLGPYTGDPWGDTVQVRVRPQTWGKLQQLQALLPSSFTRYYLDGTLAQNGFWKGVTDYTHAEMDLLQTAGRGIPVVTSDAAGTSGGRFLYDSRKIKHYPPEHQAPLKSSNFREFDMVVEGVTDPSWAPAFAGGRLLVRTDNTTSASIVNRQGTMATELSGLSTELTDFCRVNNIDLAAVHIPGLINWLADKLSRWKWERDNSNWQVDVNIVLGAWLRTGLAQWFTLDGGADPVGSNAFCPRYCSVVDSIFDRHLGGEHLWNNPDFDIMEEVLRHIIKCHADRPFDSSATVLVPFWDAKFIPLLRGSKLLAFIPKGSPAFTSPDWNLLQSDPLTDLSLHPRVFRGNTQWPCVIVHFPPVVPHRSGHAAAGGSAAADLAHRLRKLQQLPTMRGDYLRDLDMMRALPADDLHQLRRSGQDMAQPPGEVSGLHHRLGTGQGGDPRCGDRAPMRGGHAGGGGPAGDYNHQLQGQPGVPRFLPDDQVGGAARPADHPVLGIVGGVQSESLPGHLPAGGGSVAHPDSSGNRIQHPRARARPPRHPPGAGSPHAVQEIIRSKAAYGARGVVTCGCCGLRYGEPAGLVQPAVVQCPHCWASAARGLPGDPGGPPGGAEGSRCAGGGVLAQIHHQDTPSPGARGLPTLSTDLLSQEYFTASQLCGIHDDI